MIIRIAPLVSGEKKCTSWEDGNGYLEDPMATSQVYYSLNLLQCICGCECKWQLTVLHFMVVCFYFQVLACQLSHKTRVWINKEKLRVIWWIYFYTLAHQIISIFRCTNTKYVMLYDIYAEQYVHLRERQNQNQIYFDSNVRQRIELFLLVFTLFIWELFMPICHMDWLLGRNGTTSHMQFEAIS